MDAFSVVRWVRLLGSELGYLMGEGRAMPGRIECRTSQGSDPNLDHIDGLNIDQC